MVSECHRCLVLGYLLDELLGLNIVHAVNTCNTIPVDEFSQLPCL